MTWLGVLCALPFALMGIQRLYVSGVRRQFGQNESGNAAHTQAALWWIVAALVCRP